ncbi:MAG: hypothetical protein ABI045_03910 [Flavobacteriales bacterium]
MKNVANTQRKTTRSSIIIQINGDIIHTIKQGDLIIDDNISSLYS